MQVWLFWAKSFGGKPDIVETKQGMSGSRIWFCAYTLKYIKMPENKGWVTGNIMQASMR